MGNEETEDGLEWSSGTKVEWVNELDEFRLKAYESPNLYKEKMKQYHDQKIENQKNFVRNLVLLFNSKLRLFLGKLKSK